MTRRRPRMKVCPLPGFQWCVNPRSPRGLQRLPGGGGVVDFEAVEGGVGARELGHHDGVDTGGECGVGVDGGIGVARAVGRHRVDASVSLRRAAAGGVPT